MLSFKRVQIVCNLGKDDWFNGVIRIDENDYKNSVKKFLEPGRYLTEALFV